MAKDTSYTQCKLQFEPFNDPSVYREDIVYIPTKFAVQGKNIIVDKPFKRNAKVLEVFKSSTKDINEIQKTKWNNNI